jgi:inorganic pyrophosphatase
LIDVRIVGIIEAKQTEDGETERNDRLLGVAIHSYDHQHITSIDQVSKDLRVRWSSSSSNDERF